MIITQEQQCQLLEAAKPLISWLNQNCHPHCVAHVDQDTVELTESIAMNRDAQTTERANPRARSNATPKNKQEELILRMFVLIKRSHFSDHKLLPSYLDPVRFPRTLGNAIASFIKDRFPGYYDEQSRRNHEPSENAVDQA